MNEDAQTRRARVEINNLPVLTTLIRGSSQTKSLTERLFELLGQLQFDQCLSLIKLHEKQKHVDGEMISSLKMLLQCEKMYTSAHFNSEKQDLHHQYSSLSSKLSLLVMTAPSETKNDDATLSSPPESTLNNGNDYARVLDLDEHEIALSKELLQDTRLLIQLRQEMIEFYRMLSRTKQTPKFDNFCKIVSGLRSKLVDRVKHKLLYKQAQNAYFELDAIHAIFKTEGLICKYRYKEAVFSFFRVKNILKSWKELHAQSSNQSSAPPSPISRSLINNPANNIPSFDDPHFNNVISDYQQKVSPRDVSINSVVDESYFTRDDVETKPAVTLQLKRKPMSPMKKIPTRPNNQQHSQQHQQSHTHSLNPSLFGSLVNMIKKTTPPPHLLENGRELETTPMSTTSSLSTTMDHHSDHTKKTLSKDFEAFSPPPAPQSTTPNTSLTSTPNTPQHHLVPSITSMPIQPKEVNLLTETNLYRWLNMMHSFTVSKYTLYFRDVLRCNTKTQFSELCGLGIVDYYASIESFANVVNPFAICLIMNCGFGNQNVPGSPSSSSSHSTEKYHLTQSYYEIDKQGYSLCNRLKQMKMFSNELESDEDEDDDSGFMAQSGNKSWPCIFSYPEQVDRNLLRVMYWPDLLSLIMDNSGDLEKDIEPLCSCEEKSSYYVCCVDPKIYMCVIFNFSTKTKPKVNKLTMDFMFHMNIYMRRTKLFSYLNTFTVDK
ncbi:hypothetical protein AKO1_015303 [Acrasis kona]|uniref:Uncharacterized protein n=1 Tax=Acrasis kona TaxID=1008807 RepID=A0AAW2ZER5_9EUKA